MEFNTNKISIVRFGESKYRPLYQCKLGDAILNTSGRGKRPWNNQINEMITNENLRHELNR